jgi:hypothetical protein
MLLASTSEVLLSTDQNQRTTNTSIFNGPVRNITEVVTALQLIDTPWTEPARFVPTVTAEPSSLRLDETILALSAPALPVPVPKPTPALTPPSVNRLPPGTPRPVPNPPQPPPGQTTHASLAPNPGPPPGRTPLRPFAQDIPQLDPSLSEPSSGIPASAQKPSFVAPVIGTVSFEASGPGILLPSATKALQPGETTFFNGNPVSFDTHSSVLVVGTQHVTFSVPPAVPALPTSFAVLSSSSGILLPNGQTLTPGGITTVNGVPVSFDASATAVVIGTDTILLEQLTNPTALPSDFSLLPSASGLLLPNGQTLAPGAVTTIDAVVVSLSPSATAVVIGSDTISLAKPTSLNNLPSGFSLLPSASGILLPNGQTLTPGAATTINGIPMSLSPSLTAVLIGGSTIPLNALPTGPFTLPNGQTLTPGVLTTVNGVPFSLASSGSTVFVNGTALTTTSGSVDIGGYIWSGLGGGATSPSDSALYTGSANRRDAKDLTESWAIIVVAVAHAIL